MRSSRRDALTGGPALFRIVRFWSRRWAAGAAEGAVGDRAHIGRVTVLEAIDAAGDGGRGGIAEVARELGLDRSNASRMLADAVAAGLVKKMVSPADGRRTELELTPAGKRMLRAARGWQEDVFRRLVADWPSQDADQFADYLARLASQPLAPQLKERPDDDRP